MLIVKTNNILSMTSTPATGYKFVHIINKVTITVETIIHDEITDSISSKTLTDDGYYQVAEIKLTTTPGNYWYITGDTIYLNGVEKTSAELFAADPNTGGITRTDYDIINTYILSNYYTNLLKSAFTKDLCVCGCTDKYERITMDVLIMGMELINQLTLIENYYEVQRIIERLSVCNNLLTSGCDCYE